MNKWKKRLLAAGLTCVLAVLFTTPAFAAGDVAQAIQGTWTAAQSQIKAVVENVVFPVIDMILAILRRSSFGWYPISESRDLPFRKKHQRKRCCVSSVVFR